MRRARLKPRAKRTYSDRSEEDGARYALVEGAHDPDGDGRLPRFINTSVEASLTLCVCAIEPLDARVLTGVHHNASSLLRVVSSRGVWCDARICAVF